MHYAVDEKDFEGRLNRLSGEDLTYLVNRVLDESECPLCISTEYAKIFVDVLAEKVQKRRRSGYRGCTNRRLGTNFKLAFWYIVKLTFQIVQAQAQFGFGNIKPISSCEDRMGFRHTFDGFTIVIKL
jgi:hypothetical protein